MLTVSVSFATDIRPLFTDHDVSCMTPYGVMLAAFGYMSDAGGDGKFADHANARHVHAHIVGTEHPRMPLHGPYWSEANVALFAKWMSDGFLP